MKTQILTYLSSLFFFKIAVGAILLVTGWDSLGIYGNGLINITVIMALSFFPAAFARPLFQKFGTLSNPKLLTISLWFAGCLIMLEYFLMGKTIAGMFTVHFILWIFIFIIEVACEKWYVSLTQTQTLNKIRKLSGVSTSIGQIGVIIGPLAIMLAKEKNQSLPYLIILSSFIMASIFTLYGAYALPMKSQSHISNKVSTISKENQDYRKILYILGFSLIWPTLTIFNLSIPILAKSEYNSINVAGILEMLIGFATAIAGFVHPYITQSKNNHKQRFHVFTLLFISSFLTYLCNSSFLMVSCGIFLLGLSFGYLRVELRSHLSRRFNPKTAGEIIASANSWSGLFVIAYAILFYICMQIQGQPGLTLMFPISFIICSSLFIYILNDEEKIEVLCENQTT